MRQENLSVKTRETGGKGAARRLRNEGMVPAVFYGKKTDTLSIAVSSKDLKNIISGKGGTSTLLNLKFDGEKDTERMAIIKELQADPVTDRLIHADFLELQMDEKMTVSIPVSLTGKAKGIELGGTLQPIRRELEVSCLPKNVPNIIEIDVTELGLGESIHIDDVKLPDGVEVPHDVNFTIAVVLAKRGAAEGEEEGEAEGAEVAEGEASAEA